MPETYETGSRVIRDPVYGYIELPHSLAPLVDDPIFQRLRRVGQTSLTSAVYPAATGTRFEHGLGAMHLARRAWRAIWASADELVRGEFQRAVENDDIELPAARFSFLIGDALGGVALLHDLGHPPFSHVLEAAFRRLAWTWFDPDVAMASDVAAEQEVLTQELFRSQESFHEAAGLLLLRELLDRLTGQLDAPLRQLMLRISLAPPSKKTWASALHGVVAGEVDVDRLDYLMRDAQRAGTEFGAIDWERLVDALELHQVGPAEFMIGPGVRARSAVETVLLQRTQSYKWITFHPRVVGMNLALARAVEMLIERERHVDDATAPQIPGVTPPPWPDLNYISPRENAVSSLLDLPHQQQESIPYEVLRDHRALLQAGVDDGRLLEHLKRAALSCRARLSRPEELKHEDGKRLKELRAYLDAVLVRRKNFVAAWKTVEEFRGVVRRLIDSGLVGQVDGAFEDLARHFGENSVAAEWLRPRQEASVARLQEERIPVAGVNHLLRMLLADRRGQRQLRAVLQRQPDLPEGFWEVEFIKFRAVRERGNLAVLFDGFKPVPLIETSPLVQALHRVDEGGTSMFAYYFVTAEEGLSAWREYRLGLARDLLRGAFVQAFPEFVHAGLKRLMEEFLAARSS